MLRIRIAIVLLSSFLVLESAAPRDRGAAREAFRQAIEYHQWLLDQPRSQRTVDQYRRSIFLFRTVIDHDPTYGACDDSIYFMARLFDEMAERFKSKGYRNRAIYYYEFVASEYPLTRHKKAAVERAKELQQIEVTSSKPVQRQSGGTSKLNLSDIATLSEVRYWSNEDYTRVVLQLDKEIEFEKSVLANPDRIYFDLSGTRVDSTVGDRQFDVNGLFIKRIRVAENRPDVIRVVLDFDRINHHTVFALYDPFRIVIDTRGKPESKPTPVPEPDQAVQSAELKADGAAGTPPPVDPVPSEENEPDLGAPPSPTIRGDWTLTRTLGLKVGRVVIDPGHGGRDTGTIGPTGLREKDLVLSISRNLKDLLEHRLGTEVILTRDSDRLVPLEERTAIANQQNADLFISVHANASRNKKVSGIETYVLDFATSDAEREIASRENASAQRNISDLEDLLKQIALEDYNQESRDLAHVVQNGLVEVLTQHSPQQRNRGIKQAPFIVLIGSNMPSILTEIGFISNPEDEKFFKSEEAKDHVAEALYRGVEDYFRSLGTLPNIQRAASATGR